MTTEQFIECVRAGREITAPDPEQECVALVGLAALTADGDPAVRYFTHQPSERPPYSGPLTDPTAIEPSEWTPGPQRLSVQVRTSYTAGDWSGYGYSAILLHPSDEEPRPCPIREYAGRYIVRTTGGRSGLLYAGRGGAGRGWPPGCRTALARATEELIAGMGLQGVPEFYNA